MSGINSKVTEVEGVEPDAIPYASLLQAQKPTIFKGAARHWPLVAKGLQGAQEAIAYLASFDAGRPIVGYTGAPEIKGRFFYNADLTGLNFERGRFLLKDYLAQIEAHLDDPKAPSFYIGSTDLDIFLPGIRQENDLILNDPMFEANPPVVSIWIGNRTVATAHYDMSNNLACCMVGHRRFTLFPPDQVANLYPGPLEPTPGGQVVSMVDFSAPDFDRFPRFREALDHALVADLEPGDVLFYPALWWHHVEALDSFNAMINYWWNQSPAFMDTPMNTILHGLLSLRDRPEAEKQAWRNLFDFYLFGSADTAAAHLPDHAKGPLAPLDAMEARRLRALLLNRMNR